MRSAVAVVLFAFTFLCSADAQVVTALDVRTAMRDGESSYHFVEVFQTRGRFIVPRVGYFDFGDSKHSHEFFVGAGYKFLDGQHVSVSQGLYFTRTGGSESHGADYIQPWTEVRYTITPNFGGKVVLAPYIPLDHAGQAQFVLERAGLEYGSTIRLGVGYASYQLEHEEWMHGPFVALAVAPASGKYGVIELWYQRLSHGASQVQVRYELHLGGTKHEKH